VSDEDGKTGGRRGDFLTARQLAALLQVSESTVRRLAREGRIPVVRLTARLARYHLDSVLRALDGDGTQQPTRKRRAQEPSADGRQLSFDDLT
jgi:excisionase family DNA binding protein